MIDGDVAIETRRGINVWPREEKVLKEIFSFDLFFRRAKSTLNENWER